MPTTMLTPIDSSAARQSGGASRLWRKQLLPVGEIEYRGRKIQFTAEYLAGLARAFSSRAFDQVPFQFADGKNSHTNDPERFRGEIRGFEQTEEGLDLILAATDEGDAYLRKNPGLGVSARIVEDYQRADGQFFPAAIQHVLGTLDPRITGMHPWQAIEAANDGDGELIDLTDQHYPGPDDESGTAPRPGAPSDPADHGTPDEEEGHMALTADQEARLAKLLDLPEDRFDALLAATEAPADGGDGADAADQLSDEDLKRLLDSLPDDDEGDGDAGDGDGGGEGDGDGADADAGDRQPAAAGAALSRQAQDAIDLANSRAEQTELELARVTTALNKAAYERERDHFSREYGIPPRIFDLGRHLLEGEGHTIDLANGSQADAGGIVRKMLTELGQTIKVLDLSGEVGTPLDFSAEQTQAAEEQLAADRADLVKAYRAQTGL